MHKNNVQQPDDIDCNAVNESNNEYLTPSTIDHNKDKYYWFAAMRQMIHFI
jgi:hypothetical protein